MILRVSAAGRQWIRAGSSAIRMGFSPSPENGRSPLREIPLAQGRNVMPAVPGDDEGERPHRDRISAGHALAPPGVCDESAEHDQIRPPEQLPLGHVIDAERVWAYRALRFARKDFTELPG